jgi:hypothetical protein
LEQAGKFVNLIKEVQNNAVSVLGVSEVRWERQGEERSDDYAACYSGGESSERGVAILVHNSKMTRVVKKKTVCSDRTTALTGRTGKYFDGVGVSTSVGV